MLTAFSPGLRSEAKRLPWNPGPKGVTTPSESSVQKPRPWGAASMSMIRLPGDDGSPSLGASPKL
jgi:hypothetical protein